MRITESKLRSIIRSLILNEGAIDNLVMKYPKLQVVIDLANTDKKYRRILSKQYLLWIANAASHEPIKDFIGVVLAFDMKKPKLKQRGMSVNINDYPNPGSLRQALEALAKKVYTPSQKTLINKETTKVYESKKFLVVMPHSVESSCFWGASTTWCTAATQSQNLFLSYVGDPDHNVILYYIIEQFQKL